MPPKQARSAHTPSNHPPREGGSSRLVRAGRARRALITGGALLLILSGAGVAAAASPSPDRLRDFVCQRNLDPPARAVTVEAVMRPLPGTLRMALRFDLLRRKPHQHKFAAVHAGDLDRWVHPADRTLGQRPGDIWKYYKQVVDLPAPAWYRFRVTFRWTGTDGVELGKLVRTTGTCYQPELRPDLLVRSITVQALPGQPAQDAYTAVIANGGATAAGPFQVQFTDAGQSQEQTIEQLGAYSSVTERFVGAVCTAHNAPTVIVDPNDQVDDYNRSNNTLAAKCPSSSSS